ncbi:MAG: BPL-N domain-containing protein [Pyrinomonadaceae bacterium]|nr:BPL-N domain-containing protein [Pyrinomonadaceae bacterium]
MIHSNSNEVMHSRVPLPAMDTPRRVLIIALVLIATAFTACGVGRDKGGTAKGPNAAPILLFNGTGTSPNDVAAVETILNNNNLNYSTANSSQLNEMNESQIREYRLLIIPGGNFIDIGNGLTPSTTANIRNAVQNGVNYLGICAGGFFAGNSAHYNGLNLTSGVTFGFYAAENQGIRKAAVPIAVAGGATLEHYWEDGPEFTGWGSVVGKYPDGTPAIVEGTFGSGWVVLTGVHPEAPANWRHGMTFNTPVSEDNAYAGTLIHAALNRTTLSH